MSVFMTSDLKNRTGEILDAAKKTPQFVFRAGELFMIARAEPGPAVRDLPEGYFADAYPGPEERLKLEKAMSKQPQHPER
ncbi:MAG: hypothetical protein ACLPYZ_05535 [Limisphaerales bacterium]|jgi:hypothetical protein